MLRAAALHQVCDAGQGVEGAHDGRGVAQVFNGLEQRHHNQVAYRVGVQRAAQQAGFFLQQQYFQQIAHAFGVADDVVADGFVAETLAHVTRHFKNRQFALGMFGIRGAAHAQCARVVQQTCEQGAFCSLVQGAVVGCDAGCAQQFCHHGLMFVRALAQVHGGQMKAEHLNRADQRAQALRRQGAAVVFVQRLLDGAQVVSQFFRQVVRVLRGHGVGHCLGSGQRL